MITFLPFPSFFLSAECLDSKRLMKQRVEAFQLINAIEKKSVWINHPACKMWIDYIEALKLYFNIIVFEVKQRGFTNNIPLYKINKKKLVKPWWLGYMPLHNSHKASLLRKNDTHYSKEFSISEKYKGQGYVWPTKLTEEQQEKIKMFMLDKIEGNPYSINELSDSI